MKKEEKELVCEWLDKFADYLGSSYLNENLPEFKADNDLIVKDELWNKWLVYKEYPKCMFYHDSKTQLVYGIDIFGEWYKPEKNSNNFETYTEATPEEIELKLSAMAVKLGYVEGVEVKSLVEGYKDIVTDGFFVTDNQLWADCEKYNILLMQDGIWAKITATPNRELSTEEWNERIGLDEHVKALTDLGYIVTVEKK